jgi:hypothetical protein
MGLVCAVCRAGSLRSKAGDGIALLYHLVDCEALFR